MAGLLSGISDVNLRHLSPDTMSEIEQHGDQDETKLSNKAIDEIIRATQITEQDKYTEKLRSEVPRPDVGQVEAALRGVTSGFTANLAPRIEAAGEAVIRKARGSQAPIGDIYEASKYYQMQREQQAAQESPWIYGGASIVGAMANPLLATAGGLAGNIAKQAAIGATQAYGASEKPTLEDMATGAGIGGAVGGVLSGQALGSVRRIAAPMVEKVQQYAGEMAFKAAGGMLKDFRKASRQVPGGPASVGKELLKTETTGSGILDALQKKTRLGALDEVDSIAKKTDLMKNAVGIKIGKTVKQIQKKYGDLPEFKVDMDRVRERAEHEIFAPLQEIGVEPTGLRNQLDRMHYASPKETVVGKPSEITIPGERTETVIGKPSIVEPTRKRTLDEVLSGRYLTEGPGATKYISEYKEGLPKTVIGPTKYISEYKEGLPKTVIGPTEFKSVFSYGGSKYPRGLDFNKAMELRKRFDDHIKAAYQTNSASEIQVMQMQYRRILDDEIMKSLDRLSSFSGEKNIAKQFKDLKSSYANYARLNEMAQDRVLREKSNRYLSLTDYMAGGAAAVSGGAGFIPAAKAAAAAAINRAVRTRGAAMTAVTANTAARLLRSPERLGKFAPVLQRALQKGPESFIVTHDQLYKTEPEYKQAIDEEGKQ